MHSWQAVARGARAVGGQVLLGRLTDPALVIGAWDAQLADGAAATTGRQKWLRALTLEDRAAADVAGNRLLVRLQLFFGRGTHPRSMLARRLQPPIRILQRKPPAARGAREPPRNAPGPSCSQPAHR